MSHIIHIDNVKISSKFIATEETFNYGSLSY